MGLTFIEEGGAFPAQVVGKSEQISVKDEREDLNSSTRSISQVQFCLEEGYY